MQADFLDAHERHWNDAEHLLQAQRWANADHLYGMAAECGLKRLMLAFNMPYNTIKDQPADPQDRVHADGAWSRLQTYSSGHPQAISYILPNSNPFSNWHVSDRYAHQSNFNQAYVQAHKTGAQAVCNLIAQARRDGLII